MSIFDQHTSLLHSEIDEREIALFTLSIYISLIHTHSHSSVFSHLLSHSLTNTLNSSLTKSHTHILSHSLTHFISFTHSLTQTHTFSNIHSLLPSLTFSFAHTLTHTLIHNQTHLPPLTHFLSPTLSYSHSSQKKLVRSNLWFKTRNVIKTQQLLPGPDIDILQVFCPNIRLIFYLIFFIFHIISQNFSVGSQQAKL